jgi:hypothetical protein
VETKMETLWIKTRRRTGLMLAHPPYGHRLDGTYPHAAEKQKATCSGAKALHGGLRLPPHLGRTIVYTDYLHQEYGLVAAWRAAPEYNVSNSVPSKRMLFALNSNSAHNT